MHITVCIIWFYPYNLCLSFIICKLNSILYESLLLYIDLSYLALAFEHANSTIFNEANGMRPGVKHVIIALTNGNESNHVARSDGTFPPTLNVSVLALKSRGKSLCYFFYDS